MGGDSKYVFPYNDYHVSRDHEDDQLVSNSDLQDEYARSDTDDSHDDAYISSDEGGMSEITEDADIRSDLLFRLESFDNANTQVRVLPTPSVFPARARMILEQSMHLHVLPQIFIDVRGRGKRSCFRHKRNGW
jgi:hypothetical protein